MAETNTVLAPVEALLDQLYPRMEADLLQLLRLASVREAAEPGAPFGRPVAQALAYCLNLADSLGLVTENVDGYMGLAELPGAGTEQVGVLTHLDVVPANAAEWRYSPYQPVIENGRIYGRGTLDNKGPLIASLYAGVALAQCGIPLRKKVLLMFGCDEESEFACLGHYLQVRQPPGCGFSPDGRFPLVIGEKGLGAYKLRAAWPSHSGDEGLYLRELTAGTKSNIVPDQAVAIFSLGETAPFTAPPAAAGIQIQRLGQELRISATGKAAHASLPQDGENALVKLLIYLSGLNFAPAGAQTYTDTLSRLLADDSYGADLGIAAADEHSRLTNVPTLLRLDGSGGELTCDMRFPVTHQAAPYQQRLQQVAAANGLTLADWQSMAPLFATPSHPVAASLLKAYRDCTGDYSEPLVTGGATYAKMIRNFFAFGPCFAGQPFLAHQADEYIEGKEWLKTAKIYAHAIYELAK